jgi:hypothetical protein
VHTDGHIKPLQRINAVVAFRLTTLKSIGALNLLFETRYTEVKSIILSPHQTKPNTQLTMRLSLIVLSLATLGLAADMDIPRYADMLSFLLGTYRLTISSSVSSSILATPDTTSGSPITSAVSSTGSVIATTSASANSTSTAKKNGAGLVKGDLSGFAALVVGVAPWLV